MLSLPSPADLRAERHKLGLTQAAVARAAGVSQPLVARIERGTVDPRYSTLKGIVDALNRAARETVRLKDVMTREIVSVRPSDALGEAIRVMRAGGFSQLPVVHKGAPVGSLSERDVVHALATAPREDVVRLPVREVMGPPFPTASPEDPVESAARLLEDHPAVLVMERGRVVGLVAKSNLLETVR